MPSSFFIAGFYFIYVIATISSKNSVEKTEDDYNVLINDIAEKFQDKDEKDEDEILYCIYCGASLEKANYLCHTCSFNVHESVHGESGFNIEAFFVELFLDYILFSQEYEEDAASEDIGDFVEADLSIEEIESLEEIFPEYNMEYQDVEYQKESNSLYQIGSLDESFKQEDINNEVEIIQAEIDEKEDMNTDQEEKIKCSKCGATLKYGSIFCTNCFGS